MLIGQGPTVAKRDLRDHVRKKSQEKEALGAECVGSNPDFSTGQVALGLGFLSWQMGMIKAQTAWGSFAALERAAGNESSAMGGTAARGLRCI